MGPTRIFAIAVIVMAAYMTTAVTDARGGTYNKNGSSYPGDWTLNMDSTYEQREEERQYEAEKLREQQQRDHEKSRQWQERQELLDSYPTGLDYNHPVIRYKHKTK